MHPQRLRMADPDICVVDISSTYLLTYLLNVRHAAEYTFRNGVIRWQISKSINVLRYILAVARNVNEILGFEITDLLFEGQIFELRHLR